MKITLDPSLKAMLPPLDQPVEVCEPDGRTVAFVVPVEEYQRMRRNDAQMRRVYDEELKKVSIEELEAEYQSTTEWFTTDEVIRHAESQCDSK